MGVLYIVGTPIGNLEDMSFRALRVLREVSLIAAEDTRATGRLLSRYDIATPMLSYFEHNKLIRQGQLLRALDEGDVALVSQAGTPGISDPGYELIGAAVAAGARVVSIPGPSAPIASLVVSGLPTNRFLFLGFLPRRAVERRRLLRSVSGESGTLVAFEVPHRLQACLEDLMETLNDRPLVICRELTKLHEEIWRGSIEQAVQYWQGQRPRGEFTLVIGGTGTGGGATRWDAGRVRSALESLLSDGVSTAAAARAVAKLAGWRKRDVYDLVLSEDGPGHGV